MNIYLLDYKQPPFSNKNRIERQKEVLLFCFLVFALRFNHSYPYLLQPFYLIYFILLFFSERIIKICLLNYFKMNSKII